jgi:pimeloyl-ACP methyl ester carboxylesterase
MPIVTANGMSLEYDEFGAPDAPAMLLIMGLGSQLIAWPQVFCGRLAEHGLRVIRFDNRDVGLSTKLDGVRVPVPLASLLNPPPDLASHVPYTLDDMALDAVGVLDALQIDKAHIVGASMGGMIAQLVASHHAERTITLTSIMSTSGSPELPGPRANVAQHMFLSRPRDSSLDAAIEHYAKTWQLIGSPAYPMSDGELRERVRIEVARSLYPQGFIRQYAAIAASGSRVDALRRITAPTLVIHGSDDPLVPVEGGRDTAANVPESKLEIIDGMGHDFPGPLLPRLVESIARHALADR